MGSPPEYRGHSEGRGGSGPRSKVGLETPLTGRFWGEDKKLVFAPPAWYQGLVLACFVGGGVLALAGAFGWRTVPFAGMGVWLGPAVVLAGVWAAVSMEYAVFDLKAKTYLRREGRGFAMRTRRGSLAQLDAVVVVTERYPVSVTGEVVVYRTVLHWKNAVEPLMVAERSQHRLMSGAPMGSMAGSMVARAQRYAAALGVRFYDNTYFASSAPLRPL